MIAVQMSGGLGNQMFQYALYRRLLSLGRDARIDDWSQYGPREDGAVVRRIGLGVFGAEYRKAAREEVNLLTDGAPGLKDRVRRRLTGRRTKETRDVDFLYDPRFLEAEEGYFTGCFQSEKYFAPIGEEIRQCFAFPEDFPGMSESVRRLGERMQEEASVCVHLRFGDYVEKSDIYGGICTEEYYRRAVRLFLSRFGERAVFYLFSDDAERAEEAARKFGDVPGARREQFVQVQPEGEDSTYSDLYLMTKCRNHVIANSSYSWWGSYLARSDGQWVVAPSVWMHGQGGNEFRHRDIYREEMLLVSPEGRLVRIPEDMAARSGLAPAGEDMDRPLVSVIVPAYNIERYIEGAMTSLAAQTWERLQIIAVDDGSTDRTGEVLDRLAAGDRRIEVIHKENGGLSDARNAGLPRVKGEYTAYLDGDDRMDPLMIESMVRAAMTAAADLVTVRYRQVAEEFLSGGGQPAGSGDTPERTADEVLGTGLLLTGHEAVRAYVEEADEAMVTNSVWSKLFRTSLVKDLRFPKGRNAEDIVYTTKALVRAAYVAHLPCPLYNYLVDRQGSIMNEKHAARRLNDEIPFWREKIAILKENGEEEAARMAEYRLYRRMLVYWRQFRHPDPGAGADVAPAEERLKEMLLKDREEISRIAGEPFVPRGDRRRFECFLLSPGLYDSLAGFYERAVVPVKQKIRG